MRLSVDSIADDLVAVRGVLAVLAALFSFLWGVHLCIRMGGGLNAIRRRQGSEQRNHAVGSLATRLRATSRYRRLGRHIRGETEAALWRIPIQETVAQGTKPQETLTEMELARGFGIVVCEVMSCRENSLHVWKTVGTIEFVFTIVGESLNRSFYALGEGDRSIR